MSVKSVENIDRLYWLGRYSERVYTTIKLYSERFDSLIEEGADNYEDFCTSLEIPNIYTSVEDFRTKYPFGKDDPNSIYSNMIRVYNNAIELREEIGSETLSYVQMAVYEINKAAISEAPVIEFQTILDYILAFWGIVDDMIEDEHTRNIIKVGKRVERIDLYGRLHANRGELLREVHRLNGRIIKSGLKYNEEALREVTNLVEDNEVIDYRAVVVAIERIMEV